MIGNDIIDLAEARLTSNWQRKGFIAKVFSPSEQEIIRATTDPFLAVWRMWSMKESAYKLYLQKETDAKRGFYPAKIITSLLTPKHGSVSINGIDLNTQTETFPTHLYSTAFYDSTLSVETKIFYVSEKDYQFQSTFTRAQLLSYISVKKQLDKTYLTIKKNSSKVPQLFFKGELLPFKFSLTHHGNYGGFSILRS